MTEKFQHVLTLTIALFTAVVCLCYSLAIMKAIEKTEDHLINNHIQSEYSRIKHLIDSLPMDQAAVAMRDPQHWLNQSGLMLTDGLRIHTNNTALPIPAIRSLKTGVHELNEYDLHVLIGDDDSDQNKLILVYDGQAISRIDQLEPYLNIMVVVIGIGIILLGIVAAHFIARKIAFPITNLSQQLKTDHPRLPFIEEQRPDEIGELAKTFSNLLTRINGFLSREQQFTRHASHELRTPLGIITNCLAVLKLPDINDEKKQRNLERIEQSTRRMDELINMFLILGREQNLKDKTQPVMLNRLIQQAIEKTSPADIKIELASDGDVSIDTNPVLVSILLDNLIRNALTHCRSEITIRLNLNQIEISNDCDNNSAATKGYGFGQEIINRITDELNWRIKSQQSTNSYCVNIEF